MVSPIIYDPRGLSLTPVWDDPIITLAWNPIEIKQIGAHEAERRHWGGTHLPPRCDALAFRGNILARGFPLGSLSWSLTWSVYPTKSQPIGILNTAQFLHLFTSGDIPHFYFCFSRFEQTSIVIYLLSKILEETLCWSRNQMSPVFQPSYASGNPPADSSSPCMGIECSTKNTGWWFHPPWKIFVRLDHHPNYWGK